MRPTAKSSSSPDPSAESSERRDLLAVARGRSLVAIGGGTGLSAALRGLKALAVPGGLAELVGVVTVTDDGGSSGRLRREFGMLPPGDIRNCIVALADDEDLLARLFQYRFPMGDGLTGHSFGNLFLTALTGVTGDFYQAILFAESVLSVRGKILPATMSDVQLLGHGRSGRLYEGEVAVGRSGEELDDLALEPAAPQAFPAAVSAIETADVVLLGPGSLYTSILPNLLIPGIRDALLRTAAPKVLILNLMTEPGETDGMTGLHHLEAILREVGPGVVDTVLANSTELPLDLIERYGEMGSLPVAVDAEELSGLGVELYRADLLEEGEKIRHDPAKLERAVVRVMAAASRRAQGRDGEDGAGAVVPLRRSRETG